MNKTGDKNCGVCDKNAKNAAILCTGPCKKWIHFKCINLTYSLVKSMSKNDIGVWKCPVCRESVALEARNINVENETDDKSGFDVSLSLATEIGSAIMQENENLKQELHETKTKKLMYELELEDKLQQKEEDTRELIKTHNERESAMSIVIESLESKLRAEQRLRGELILLAENYSLKTCNNKNLEPRTFSKPQDVSVFESKPKDFQTQIILQELNSKKQEIENLNAVVMMLEQDKRTLESDILELRAQNLNSKCLRCFPELRNSLSNERIIPKKPSYTQGGSKVFEIQCRNKFQVLTPEDENNDDDGEVNDTTLDLTVGDVPNRIKYSRRKKLTGSIVPTISNPKKHSKEVEDNHPKVGHKMLVCADSHGHGLTWNLNKILRTHETVAFVTPGGGVKRILNPVNIQGEKLADKDILVILCGTNDVSRNEAKEVISTIKDTLQEHANKNIILVNIPYRYDLVEWSCVNEEVRKTNVSLSELSCQYTNVKLVNAYDAERHLHTRHGMHFNYKGKLWLTEKICEAAKTFFDSVEESEVSLSQYPTLEVLNLEDEQSLVTESMEETPLDPEVTVSASGNSSPIAPDPLK